MPTSRTMVPRVLLLLALSAGLAKAADVGSMRTILHQTTVPVRMDDTVGTTIAPPTLVPCGPPLLVSNSPETFGVSGVLFKASVTGPFRLFFHHSNGTGVDMELVVRFTHASPSAPCTLRLARTAQGSLPICVGRDAATVGQKAVALGLAAQGQAGSDVRVPAGQPYEIAIPMAPGDVASGCLDGRVDSVAGASVTLFSRDDATRPAPSTVLPRSPALPGVSPTIRGTFAHADRRAEIQFQGRKPERLDLGSPRDGPFACSIPGEYEAGRDETDGSTVWNVGNYGVVYNLGLRADSPGRLLWNAAGGPSRFVVGTSVSILFLDTGLPAHGGWGLGTLSPQTPLWLQLTVPGGSFAAGRLLWVP